MVESMLLLTIITFISFASQSYATFEDCIEQNGKEIVLGVCIPERYDKMSPPTYPTFVQVNFKITGLKKVDLLSNSFSIYLKLYREWHDPRLQTQWIKNQTLKYLRNEINDKIWLPWIFNPHDLHQEMTDRKITLHREVTI